MTKVRLMGVGVFLAVGLIAFQNCGGRMKSASSIDTTQMQPAAANPEAMLKGVEKTILESMSPTTEAQIQQAISQVQLLINQVQVIDLSQHPELAQLRRDLMRNLTVMLQGLQNALATLHPANPPANPTYPTNPTNPTVTYPCNGNFLFSFNGGTAMPLTLTQKADGTFQFNLFPLHLTQPAQPIVNSCVNGTVTTGYIYQGMAWSMRCDGTYNVVNGKTQMSGTCEYHANTSAGMPNFPPATFSAIQQ